MQFVGVREKIGKVLSGAKTPIGRWVTLANFLALRTNNHAKARRSAVILAFMVGASLLLGAAVAWLAAAAGGQHRDSGVALDFWQRWEVDRTFLIRRRRVLPRSS